MHRFPNKSDGLPALRLATFRLLQPRSSPLRLLAAGEHEPGQPATPPNQPAEAFPGPGTELPDAGLPLLPCLALLVAFSAVLAAIAAVLVGFVPKLVAHVSFLAGFQSVSVKLLSFPVGFSATLVESSSALVPILSALVESSSMLVTFSDPEKGRPEARMTNRDAMAATPRITGNLPVCVKRFPVVVKSNQHWRNSFLMNKGV